MQFSRSASQRWVVMTFIILAISLYRSPARAESATPTRGASTTEIQACENRIADAVTRDAIDSPGQVVVVYFTPNDRPPAKDHAARIPRIAETTAAFYQDELKRHGFPNRTMNILRDNKQNVQIVDVVGKLTDKDYGKPDGGKIRDEIVSVLTEQGINPASSVLLMFCNLMDYNAEKSTISHHSPYYGGGSHLAGNAWQCDSEILDPLRFTDTTPIRDGEYGNITIGRHNSIFIGGVVHELGHALSLPHCRQRKDESVRGTALMGSGNRTFAQERRGEGRGTFLTQAHALRLAAHPVFNRRVPSTIRENSTATWDELRVAVSEDDEISVSGIVSANVPVHGVVAYFDPEGGSDYDAPTATAVADPQGRFQLRSGALLPGRSGQLRLVSCHVNGATTTKRLAYKTDAQGKPNLAAIRLELELQPMVEHLRTGDLAKASSTLNELGTSDNDLRAIGENILQRFRFAEKSKQTTPLILGEVSSDVDRVSLSSVNPSAASVGWIRPTYNAVPSPSRLLSVGGDYFAEGIYAHAPARHTYSLAGKWKQLVGKCGMQTGNAGRVDFEIVGDGRQLWSKKGVTDGVVVAYDVDVSGVDELRLIVTDGGNGTGGDWGVWIEPTLTR